MSQSGIKHDNGKLRYDILPVQAIEAITTILTQGCTKYGVDNWKGLKDPENRYYAALMRHLMEYRKGITSDPESGISHLAHVMVNAMFLMHFENKDKQIKLDLDGQIGE